MSFAAVAALSVGSDAVASPVPVRPVDRTAPHCGAHWVGSWSASPSDTVMPDEFSFLPMGSVLDQTFRMIITPHRGGNTLRIRLNNRNRHVGITYADVTIAKQASGAAIAPSTLRHVSFGGKNSVGVAANGDVTSDPVRLSFKAFEPLAVSVYVPGVAIQPSEHVDGNATSYFSLPFSGDTSSDPTGALMPVRTTTVPLVSGLDVMAPAQVSTVVAFGDSITDGYVAANAKGFPQAADIVDRNVRYPDFLQRRLDHAGKPFSVLNAGIVGNRLTVNGIAYFAGRSGEQRLRRDVIDQAGVTDVIVLEGINDLGESPRATYAQLVAGYTYLINQLHAAGLIVHLGTMLPATDGVVDGGMAVNAVRVRVNDWIRHQHLSDTVIDFDAAMRDPADPAILNPRYAGPDRLHPNATGYQAMAAAIDLDSLRGAGCQPG